MHSFMGMSGFYWFIGKVEDRGDPEGLGRCRVRILGLHTEDKKLIPTEHLPWAFPLVPVTQSTCTPMGPVEDTWVMGFFRDGEHMQEPVMLGCLLGKNGTPDENEIGFTDPLAPSPRPQPVPIDEDDVEELKEKKQKPASDEGKAAEKAKDKFEKKAGAAADVAKKTAEKELAKAATPATQEVKQACKQSWASIALAGASPAVVAANAARKNWEGVPLTRENSPYHPIFERSLDQYINLSGEYHGKSFSLSFAAVLENLSKSLASPIEVAGAAIMEGVANVGGAQISAKTAASYLSGKLPFPALPQSPRVQMTEELAAKIKGKKFKMPKIDGIANIRKAQDLFGGTLDVSIDSAMSVGKQVFASQEAAQTSDYTSLAMQIFGSLHFSDGFDVSASVEAMVASMQEVNNSNFNKACDSAARESKNEGKTQGAAAATEAKQEYTAQMKAAGENKKSEPVEPKKNPDSAGAFRPHPPDKLQQYDNGAGNLITTNNNKGYPRPENIGEPDTNRLARNIRINKTIVKLKRDNVYVGQANIPSAEGYEMAELIVPNEPFTEPTTPYNTEYPFNHVKETESGHIEEFDDTPGAERIHRYHRSGTFDEIHPVGTRVKKIVMDNFEVVLKDDYRHVEGNHKTTVDKGYRLLVNKDQEITSLDIQIGKNGDFNITLNGGNLNINVMEGDVNKYVNGDVYEHITGNVQRLIEGNVIEVIEGSVTRTIEGDIGKREFITIGDDRKVVSKGSEIHTIGKDKIDVVGGNLVEAVSGVNTRVVTGEVVIIGSAISLNP